jgi:hypothetical protein
MKLTAPLLPAAVAAPLESDTTPLAPVLARPDASETAPLDATPAAAADSTDMLPLNTDTAPPLCMAISPLESAEMSLCAVRLVFPAFAAVPPAI